MRPPEDRTPSTGESLAPPAPGPLRAFWEQFLENRMALGGGVFFALFLFVALVGMSLTTGKDPFLDPAKIRLQEKLRPPMAAVLPELAGTGDAPLGGIYVLGTDNLGRDVFARMLQGAWVSLSVGFVAVGISLVLGVFLGGIAGYYGQARIPVYQVVASLALLGALVLFSSGLLITGWAVVLGGIGCLLSGLLGRGAERREGGLRGRLHLPTLSIDTLIMRLVDIMLCFPSFFLILTVVALLPASLYNIMAVIGLTSWTGAARFVRAEFLSLREQDFVTAARALGVSNFRIVFRHMMPNAMGPVLVSSTIGIASAILTEAGLSFLGFGVPPPHATWGNILSDGKDFLFDAPWLTFAPGIAILLVVLSFNLFGEGLRDALNPRLRERR